MKNIVLYGMRACGKTTIGKKLNKKLGGIFYDLDESIEKDIGYPIFEYIEKKGWDSFRKKEHDILKKILEEKETHSKTNQYKIISLGGGAIIFENNQKLLQKKAHKLIYIESNIELICSRIQKDENDGNKRNALTNQSVHEEIRQIYNERKNIYESFYDFKVQNNEDIESCLNKILEKIDFGLICVPITNFTLQKLREQIKIINQDKNIKYTEIRIDFLDDKKIDETINIIKQINKIIIITNRVFIEGGNYKGTFESSIEKLLKFKNIGDIFDIELKAGENIHSLKKQLPNKKIILSFHDFDSSPPLSFLIKIVNKMNKYNPDIYKIALIPQDKDDIKIIYKLSDYFKNNYPNKDFIFISMGEGGLQTRVDIPKKGALLSFGSMQDISAPGQINYKQLYNLIYK